jgi:hypothetical protein
VLLIILEVFRTCYDPFVSKFAYLITPLLVFMQPVNDVTLVVVIYTSLLLADIVTMAITISSEKIVG